MLLPETFIKRMKALLQDEYPAFEEAIQHDQSVSVRLNPAKTEVRLSQTPVPWSVNGYYLDARPAFTFDPLIHLGVYYVQEASSMFLDRVISQYVVRPVRYRDLCASPGGTTTLAISALPCGSRLVRREIYLKRPYVLAAKLS